MSETPQQTRDALLDAAEDLFSTRGYAAVGIRQIAEQAGANLASIKYHFGSKRELYIETVRRAMARSGATSPWALLEEVPDDPETVAVLLARFVRMYMERLLADGPMEACGMLMRWESVQPSEAIDDVVRDYVEPGYDMMVRLVQRLLPQRDGTEAFLTARSVLSQVVHYGVFRAFIERIDGHNGRPSIGIDEAVAFIVRFSLRAMGYDEEFIDRALCIAAESGGEENMIPLSKEDET
jgi:AcrR family transcriptional regulator